MIPVGRYIIVRTSPAFGAELVGCGNSDAVIRRGCTLLEYSVSDPRSSMSLYSFVSKDELSCDGSHLAEHPRKTQICLREWSSPWE
jgi:hypothetical protein